MAILQSVQSRTGPAPNPFQDLSLRSVRAGLLSRSALGAMSQVPRLAFQTNTSQGSKSTVVFDIITQKLRFVRAAAAPVIMPQRSGDRGRCEAEFFGQEFKQQLRESRQRDP